MSASSHRWRRGPLAVVALVVTLMLLGAAGQAVARPDVPDQSVLDPATQALDKAVKAHAEKFAPRIVGSARRRITLARDIIFSAAAADRKLTSEEKKRLHTLVQQAELDARAALVKTQAKAVQARIGQLSGQDNGDHSAGGDNTGGAASGAGSSSDNRMPGGAQ